MLGDSAVLGGASSGDAVAAVSATAASAAAAGGNNTHAEAATAAGGGDGGGSNSAGEEDSRRGEEGDRSFGGNRWPRQETLALLKIRSDMDVAFRDASVKGPLWEAVSRKLAELGYHRSAKKCKEKFENVYKYHKRTKEGRSGKSDGKTYRFFDQLEALDHNHPSNIQSSSTPSSKPQQALSPTPVSVAAPPPPPSSAATMPPPPLLTNSNAVPYVSTVPSTTTIPTSINLSIPSYPPQNLPPLAANPISTPIPSSFPSVPVDLLSNSSSSSTSSDETLEGSRKRKRKWKDFFERLMKEVIDKQEELQKRFLEAIEKREHERMVREEAWRMQEMARINREREILAQERSIAAAKDAAVMAFLQKMAEQQNLGQALNNINIPQPQPSQPQPQPQAPQPPLLQAVTVAVAPQPTTPSAPAVSVQQQVAAPSPVTTLPPVGTQQQVMTNMEITRTDNGENFMAPSSSRWPKVEVQALIKLRTNLDAKYQETGPKGPLWEEISAAMRKIGYNRSAKRCKEKWENINKYFKKVKESNRKRPEDSKTCPYFHQLDALYRERNKLENPSSSSQIKPENMTTPLMVRPEQQWPPQQDSQRPGTNVTVEEADKEPMGRKIHEDEDEEDDEDRDGDEEDEEDEGGENYEIVASKPASVSAAE